MAWLAYGFVDTLSGAWHSSGFWFVCTLIFFATVSVAIYPK